MKICVSMGDPNGIGPEVLAKALREIETLSFNKEELEICISGNADTLREYYRQITFPLEVQSNAIILGKKRYSIIPCETRVDIEFGRITKEAGQLASEAIERACDAGADALVTMPVSKEALYLTGWKYPGHTEMLGDRFGEGKPLMILCNRTVRVALASVHIPLTKVIKEINFENIISKLEIFSKSLKKDYGSTKGSIGVLGLNPHAGEGGAIGTEERDIIRPAILESKLLGIETEGPFAADGFFAHGDYIKYDGILAMYHDQGLIPLKMLAQGAGVNYTANLSIVRTSPDHGTAFAIAGRGIADPRSTVEAFELAVKIIKGRNNNK